MWASSGETATVVLGCVTESAEPQIDDGGGQVGKAHPTAARFVAAKRDPGAILEAGERVLDGMALRIDRLVPRGWVEHSLLGRSMDGAFLCGQIGPQLGRDIPPVEGGILEDAVKNLRSRPAAEPREHAVPMAELGRQITPEQPRPDTPQHGFEKQPIVPRRHATIRLLARQQSLNLLPDDVAENEPFAIHKPLAR